MQTNLVGLFIKGRNYFWNKQFSTGTSCKENFQSGFVVAGGGFIFYWNHQLIKIEEEKRFGLQKQFCYYEKREINTFGNFSLQYIPEPTIHFS